MSWSSLYNPLLSPCLHVFFIGSRAYKGMPAFILCPKNFRKSFDNYPECSVFPFLLFKSRGKLLFQKMSNPSPSYAFSVYSLIEVLIIAERLYRFALLKL